MRVVVVGGQARNVGKTSVLCALLREFRGLNWTAAKITQYGHGVCSRDGRPCDCAPAEHPYAVSDERDARGRSDTGRFLAAGARRSLWLRVRQGRMASAWPAFERALAGAEWVAIESNSVLDFLAPVLYLSVLDTAIGDFKASAARFLARADALVTRGSAALSGTWPGVDMTAVAGKPVFPVAPPVDFSRDLARFVGWRLGLEPGGPSWSRAAGEEGSWPH